MVVDRNAKIIGVHRTGHFRLTREIPLISFLNKIACAKKKNVRSHTHNANTDRPLLYLTVSHHCFNLISVHLASHS